MGRRYGAGLLCVAALALSACAVAEARTEPPVGVAGIRESAPPAAAAPGAGAAPEDLRQALLTAADLPQDFVPIAAATNHNGAVSVGGGNFPGCPGLEPMTTEQTTAAAVTYGRSAMGPYVTHAVVRFPAGGAAKAMASLAGTVTACKSFSQQLAGITVRFDVLAVQPPATLGDEVVGLRMTGTTDVGIGVTADIVAIRRGDLVLWLNDTTIGNASAGLAAGLARTAATRCAQKIKGC